MKMGEHIYWGYPRVNAVLIDASKKLILTLLSFEIVSNVKKCFKIQDPFKMEGIMKRIVAKVS
jgi:hypothetical protein